MLKYGLFALVVALLAACNAAPNAQTTPAIDTAASAVAASPAPVSQPAQSVDFKACVGNHPSDCMLHDANEKHLIATVGEAVYTSFSMNFGGGEGEVELIKDATLGELVAMRGSVTHEGADYASALWVSPDGKLVFMTTTTDKGKGKLLFPADSKAQLPTAAQAWLNARR